MKPPWRRAMTLAACLLQISAACLCGQIPNQIIYSNTLQNGWMDDSWATDNLASTNPVLSGLSNSISVFCTEYGALYLSRTPSSSALYTNLTFWLNGGTSGGQVLTVTGTLDQVDQTLYTLPALASNTWQEFSIPLSALGVANQPDFDGIWIWNDTDTTIPTFYVDNIFLAAGPPPLPIIPANNFLVTSYGAVGDGKTVNTTAIANTISAASKAGGGTVEFPAAAGTYLSGPINLSNSIHLQVDAGAELQMLPYGTFPVAVTNSDNNVYTFIYCKSVHDLEISGGGTIDGQGLGWWNALASNNGNLPAPYNKQSSPPMLLDLLSCTRLFIHDITFQNAPYHHCGIRNSGGNITISNLTVSAPSTSPNTDGIDFVGTNGLIENCHISDGDDDIALGSTGPLINLVISNCAFGSGHGVSVGSTVTDGITNVTVINCSFNGTVNGIRMKCDPDASSFVTNLNYLNISMTNIQLPIVIYSYYSVTGTPDKITTAEVLAQPRQSINSTTPKWSGITISNVNIVSGGSSDIGGIIWGPVEWPISNLTLVCITNNAPKTFDLYNVYGVQIINSQFNFNSGGTFTLCNAGLTISNTVPGGGVETITGAGSANSLALYNASASMSSTNLFTANPITLNGGVLTTTNTFPASTMQNFFLGANGSTIAVTGNLSLDSTLNITAGGGFGAGDYTLFTYTGSLSGQPVLGTTPPGFAGLTYELNTNAAGEVVLVVSPPLPASPIFGAASFVSSSGNLILSGAGGTAGATYNVMTSTNVALPLNQWTPVATNQFDVGGNFIFTNLVQTNVPQRFFRLQIPQL
ncbi:MAG: glycosyl hydrolase family 28 protein [Verrucomicrobiota bacterium]|jgi:hypothetical protein